MRTGRSASSALTEVVVLTADGELAEQMRRTFGAAEHVGLRLLPGTLPGLEKVLDLAGAAVAVIDVDAAQPHELQALDRLMARVGSWLPIVAVTRSLDENVARTLLQMRLADFLVKPVSPAELVRICARVAKEPVAGPAMPEPAEAQIYTFLPAAGGVGVTTLAVQSAITLLNSGRRGRASSCLVDLDFQHGACADYLDLEPRLNIGEIEPQPERLDRQLLAVMLSHHRSGLAVVAAPNRPAEMRSFDPDVVTRLLDLVSSHFDHVVFDMPRTWFSWTDSVLLGSNRLFIVSEMTVPGLRHAKQLLEAIRERLGEGPQAQVIINRFERRMFSSGLRRSDIEQVLGEAVAAYIPNDYALVREAIDRGVPLDEVKAGNKISLQVRKLIMPPAVKPAVPAAAGRARKLGLSWAR
jgi:pilus assembly protein CpaE